MNFFITLKTESKTMDGKIMFESINFGISEFEWESL